MHGNVKISYLNAYKYPQMSFLFAFLVYLFYISNIIFLSLLYYYFFKFLLHFHEGNEVKMSTSQHSFCLFLFRQEKNSKCKVWNQQKLMTFWPLLRLCRCMKRIFTKMFLWKGHKLMREKREKQKDPGSSHCWQLEIHF